MQQAGWTDHEGVDWLVLPRADDAPAGTAHVSMLFDVGTVDQPLDQLGVIDVVAAALRRDLTRPVETGAGLAFDTDVRCDVSLTSLSVAAIGPDRQVAAVFGRLNDLLTEPGLLTLDDQVRASAERVPPVLAGWGRELAARHGPGALALSADHRTAIRAVSDDDVREFLDRMHPRRGRHRHVAITDHPGLVGCGPEGTSGGRRRPLPRTDGPLIVMDAPPDHLLAFSTDEVAALPAVARVVIGALERNLQANAPGARVAASSVYTGSGVFVAIDATSLPPTAPGAVTAAVGDTLDVLGALHDDAYLRARDAAAASAASDEGAWPGMALAALRLATGERHTPATQAAALRALTAAELRAATARVATDALRPMPAESSPPDGVPVWNPPLVPAGRTYDSVTRTPERRPAGRLRTDGHTLSALRPAAERNDPPTELAAVDLDHLVLRIDRGDDLTWLVDERLRALGVSWPHYGAARGLREVVDRSSAGVPICRQPAEPTRSAAVRRRVRRAQRTRLVIGGALAVMIVLIALAFWFRPRDQPATTETAAFGSTVELANGSTVAVSDARWTETAGGPSVSVLVRFCGGGTTRDRDASDDARNFVGRDKFTLTAAGQIVQTGGQMGDRPLLTAGTLPEGTCTEGAVGFVVPWSGVEIAVRYSNGLGDDVRWVLPPA